MIHRIELSANDSALVAKGCPLRVRAVNLHFPSEFEVEIVFTKKSWNEIRTAYDARKVRVTLGGS